MSILYQFFGWILSVIYRVIGNYGISIIIFTILAKLATLPLSFKQTKSMKEMQALQPELQKLQKKYKNNPERLNEETMKLYKLYNVSPMAGCLPLLIQFPIIMGLFGALRDPNQWFFPLVGGAEAVNTSFLWLPNLLEKDPYYILPILCVVLTFLTQKFTMTAQKGTMDEAAAKSQKMMLYLMPLMIGYAAINFPSGVALYWVVQSIFSFVQQFISLRKPAPPIDPAEAERKLEEAKKQEAKDKKEKRKMQSEARADAMAAQSGKPAKKDKPKRDKPLTKPASGKKVNRSTITKIPTRDGGADKEQDA